VSLEQWLQNGWLRQAEASVAEIQSLLEVVDRDLADARTVGLSADGGFQHAYDAALQLCMIALRASGYKVPKGQGQHKRAIDALRLTVGKHMGDTADHLERCSRLRGQSVYERSGVVSEEDARDLIDLAGSLRTTILKWLSDNHRDLLLRE
jgi:hypothetical protein